MWNCNQQQMQPRDSIPCLIQSIKADKMALFTSPRAQEQWLEGKVNERFKSRGGQVLLTAAWKRCGIARPIPA